MGDRANVKFIDEAGESVYFYTHCTGSNLPTVVRDALERGRSRWSNSAYLARIVFSEMIRDELLEETGYGISAQPYDAEGREITIDCRTQEVTMRVSSWHDENAVNTAGATFESFIENFYVEWPPYPAESCA